jgi:hypothetical protein
MKLIYNLCGHFPHREHCMAYGIVAKCKQNRPVLETTGKGRQL